MVLELIKHYGENKNIEWLIIGNGNLKQELISYLKINKNITYYKSLSNLETLDAISSSNLMIFPSRFEGIPNVLKEAGYLRVPIITSSIVGGIGELLDGGKFGSMIDEIEVNNFKIEIDKFIVDNRGFKYKADLLFENISKTIQQLLILKVL